MMSRGWLERLSHWSLPAAAAARYSLLPLHESNTAATVPRPASIPLRRSVTPTSYSYPTSCLSSAASSSHIASWSTMSPAARSVAVIVMCASLVALCWLAGIGPALSRLLPATSALPNLPSAASLFSSDSASASAAAAVSHDDVSLSTSFSLACPSSAECPYYGLRHLVVVAGHAVLTSLDYHNLSDASQWALQSFQRTQLATFIAHIERGVAIAAADPTAVLLFSGGETRPAAGPRSEAQSYWMVAELSNWWQHNVDEQQTADGSSSSGEVQWSVRSRTSTEEFARDSYENLLFSVCRFHELTQRYPERITLVGFSFKRDRFVQLHASAIRYPQSQFAYVGLDPTAHHNQSELMEGEMTNSYRPFELDPYGCFPPLTTKRLQRNPFRRSHGYGHSSSCPEMIDLLHHCGPDLYDGPTLPWQ